MLTVTKTAKGNLSISIKTQQVINIEQKQKTLQSLPILNKIWQFQTVWRLNLSTHNIKIDQYQQNNGIWSKGNMKIYQNKSNVCHLDISDIMWHTVSPWLMTLKNIDELNGILWLLNSYGFTNDKIFKIINLKTQHLYVCHQTWWSLFSLLRFTNVHQYFSYTSLILAIMITLITITTIITMPMMMIMIIINIKLIMIMS